MKSDADKDSSCDTSVSDEEMPDSSWIEWFCRLKGNQFFVEVDEDYIQDDFNLTGLSQVVPYYDDALSMILDEEEHDEMPEDDADMLESSTHMLYGLIHARYLLTTRGMQAFYDKYSQGVYGICWNAKCEMAKKYVLPVGGDVVGQESVQVYCPHCGECYLPRSSRLQQLDGAYFGSSAVHMLVLQHATAIQQGSIGPYLPLLNGFRIFPRTREQIRKREGDELQTLDCK